MEVKKAYSKVVTDLKRMKCAVHNQKADVVITGTSKEPNIGLGECCCESFEKKII